MRKSVVGCVAGLVSLAYSAFGQLSSIPAGIDRMPGLQGNQANIHWSDAPGAMSYEVRQTVNGTETVIGTVWGSPGGGEPPPYPSSLQFLFTMQDDETEYSVKIVGLDDVGAPVAESQPLLINTPTITTPPGSIYYMGMGDYGLRWIDNSPSMPYGPDYDVYFIEKKSGDGDWLVVSMMTGLPMGMDFTTIDYWIPSDDINGGSAQFRVRKSNSSGLSKPSTTLAINDPSTPSPSANLTANMQFELRWSVNPVDMYLPPTDSYLVERKAPNESTWSVIYSGTPLEMQNSMGYFLTEEDINGSYAYRVRVLNSGTSLSQPSFEVTWGIQTGPATVSANTLYFPIVNIAWPAVSFGPPVYWAESVVEIFENDQWHILGTAPMFDPFASYQFYYDDVLESPQTRQYRVRYVQFDGISQATEVSVDVNWDPAPSAPINLTAQRLGGEQLLLTWENTDPMANNGGSLNDGSGPYTIDYGVSSYTITHFDWIYSGVDQVTFSVNVRNSQNRPSEYSAPITVPVNKAPSVSLTAPAAGSSYEAPATVAMTATATDVADLVDDTVRVDFFVGLELVASDNTAPFTANVTLDEAGVYALKAQAVDSLGKASPLSIVNVTITEPAMSVDADNDGVSDDDEIAAGTNPNNWDTDYDGWGDADDNDPKSRAIIDFGAAEGFNNGLYLDPFWPALMLEARVDYNPAGAWDIAASSYVVPSSAANYAGTVNVLLDNNIINRRNLRAITWYNNNVSGTVYFQLRDYNWVNLYNNFSGIISLYRRAMPLSVSVPMANYPTACRLRMHRYYGAVTRYDSLLFIDANNNGFDDTQEAAMIAEPQADRDGDGMWDKWEFDQSPKFNFANPDENNNSISDGDEDADNDGVINKVEMVNGTNPRNAASH